MPHSFPLHALLRLADLESDKAERVGIGLELIDPFRQEVGIVGLAGKAAHFVMHPVDLDDGLGLHASNYRLAGYEIVEADGRGVGAQAERAPDETVG